MTRIPRRYRLPAAGALMLVIAVGATTAPRGLRHLETFRVRQVEVSGTRFVDPYAVVRAAGLTPLSSVFDDPEAWTAGVRTLPLVAGATVRRRLPSTVEIAVTEVEPVALVGAPELRPVDAAGWLMPLDPAGAPLDLPILAGVTAAGDTLAPAGIAREALGALAALRRDAPEVAERVSQVEARAGSVRLLFRDEVAEALLPMDPTPLQLRQLRLAYGDLSSRGELPNVRRIDVRFRDQVVVSFLTRPVS